MQPHHFNEWRAKNDLPRLFNFLKGLLPGFDTWLNELPFDMDVTLRVVPTGDIFKGEKKVVIKREGDFPDTSVIECREGTAEDAKNWWKKRQRSIEILGEIEPYFKWARRKLGRKRFFIWDKLNNQISDKFIRGSCSGLNVEGCVTRAHLFRDFTLLKMGQVRLDSGHSIIGNKNLDFCDLDFLTISGDMHGYASTWKTISYSSFRDLSFECAHVFFYKFYECWIDKILIKSSKLQDFYFEKTDVNELRLENSYIYRMGFKGSNITPFIKNTELREVDFQPKEGINPSAITTTYRMFRAAYQSNGLRREASECYYNERVFERKSYFHPHTLDAKKFQGILNGGRLSKVFDLYKAGVYQIPDIYGAIWKTLVAKIKMHTSPRLLIPLLMYRLKWLVSACECVLWGYGERPSRIVLVALAIIASYAGIYSSVDWLDENGSTYKLSLFDSIYFSIVTFTTLGYGDITPKTQLLKFFAGSEAFLGVFTMGLIIAGFSNRSRY